jgi:hypothetical protein
MAPRVKRPIVLGSGVGNTSHSPRYDPALALFPEMIDPSLPAAGKSAAFTLKLDRLTVQVPEKA